MSEQIKITFVGDLMCEPLLLNTAKKNPRGFSPVFANTKQLFDNADYVIANLETPLAGKKAGYVKGLFSFNAPEAFADAIRQAGIDCVSTANNHCLDRGYPGMLHTLKVLDHAGIAHTGTFTSPSDRHEAHYFQVGNLKLALIAYTYGTNYNSNKLLLNETQKETVNLLRPQDEWYYLRKKSATPSRKSLIKRAFTLCLKRLPLEYQFHVKKALGMPYNQPHQDDALNPATAAPYISRMQQDIRKAKESADIVLFNPHVGGQFNLIPGCFTEHVFGKALEAGCDAIIASHPHVVQKAEYKEAVPCFYSLGNFSMSPNSVYLLHEHLPDYGLAVHLYVEDKKICKVTFTILKIIETRNEMLTVYPVDDLYAELTTQEQRDALLKDISKILATVTGNSATPVQVCREYELASVNN